MGVPGLWKELQSHGHDVSLHHLNHSTVKSQQPSREGLESPPRQFRLGIDVSAWLYHALQSQGGAQPALRLLFFRFCKLLAQAHLDVTLVFDGPLRPSEKRSRQVFVAGTGGPFDGFEQLKELASAFGFALVFARGEAEAELARLNAQGTLDVIMTDDVDAFIFGARVVVRNWGYKLSGNVSRRAHVASTTEVGEDDEGLSSASSSASSQASPSKSAKKKGAESTVTIYRAQDIGSQGSLSHNGLILVALMSGGDYDVQGLPRCGAKIAVALARGGYGDSLLAGVHTHIAPPASPRDPSNRTSNHCQRPACPTPSAGWTVFRSQWVQSIRTELATNASGHLGRRYQSLSRSSDWDVFLGTNASLSVMASYVWPVMGSLDRGGNDRACGLIDVGQIVGVAQRIFNWHPSWALERMRNNLWPGLIVRQLANQKIGGIVDDHVDIRGNTQRSNVGYVARKTTLSPGRTNKRSTQQIDRFFTAIKPVASASSAADKAATGSVGKETPSVETAGPAILSVHGEKQHESTGDEVEVRILYDVAPFVRAARSSLIEAPRIRPLQEDDDAGQDAFRSPSNRSPRKAHVIPETPLRVWIPLCVIEQCPKASKLLKEYRKREEERSRKRNVLGSRKGSNNSSSSSSSLVGQSRLDSFFLPSSLLNASPSKRRQRQSPTASVELDSSDEEARGSSSSSSSFASPPPSPTMSRSTNRPSDDRLRTIKMPIHSSFPSNSTVDRRGEETPRAAPSDDVTPKKAPGPVGDDSVELVEIRPASSSSQCSSLPSKPLFASQSHDQRLSRTGTAASLEILDQDASKATPPHTLSTPRGHPGRTAHSHSSKRSQPHEVIDVFDDSDESSDEGG